MITLEQFAICTGSNQANAQKYLANAQVAMENGQINNPNRIAAFLANVGVETMYLHTMVELWGPTPQQLRYERNFDHAWPPTPGDPINKIAWQLGNAEQGDGGLFRGHGGLQTTGRGNHNKASLKLGFDFIASPLELASPRWCFAGAVMIWNEKGCSPFADVKDFVTTRHRINGGENGMHEAIKLWDAGCLALKVQS